MTILLRVALALTGLLAFTATAPAQTAGGNAFEKKSYNYAEWAKGRFSEVVTVRNPGKIIYLGGIGAEDEDSAKGGVIRHLGDFEASAITPGTRSSGCSPSTARPSRTSTSSSPT